MKSAPHAERVLRREPQESTRLLDGHRLRNRHRQSATPLDLFAEKDALRPRLVREVANALAEDHLARRRLAGDARPRPDEINGAKIPAFQQPLLRHARPFGLDQQNLDGSLLHEAGL